MRNSLIKLATCALALTLSYTTSAAAAPEYRGFQIDRYISDEEILELKNDYNVNIVRIQVGENFNMDGVTGDAYITMMEGVFSVIDPLLTKLNDQGIKVVFAMYSPPGGFETRTAPSHYQMFSDASLQPEFIAMWERIINRYGSHPAIYAFDLLNEPAMQKSKLGAGARDWNTLLLDTITAIRALAPTKLLMIKSLYGDPGKLSSLPAINDSNIIYSYHPYLFLAYQHSGIGDYPSTIATPKQVAINKKIKSLLSKFYLKHYNFFLKGKVPSQFPVINAGEVAVSAMAQNAGQFIDNLLAALESESTTKVTQRATKNLQKKKKRNKKIVAADFQAFIHHQSWTVHAFDEAPIWDPRAECVEFEDCELVGDTDRSEAIKSYLELN